MIAGVLLASGASRRFGSDKLLAPLAGRAVIRWSAEALVRAVDVLIVVIPTGAESLRMALDGLPARFVVNADAASGMASSIRAAIASLDVDVDACVVTLGDQPLIDPNVARQVIARWRAGGCRAVATAYENGRGHPVLFGASLFPALLALEGDVGARALLDGLRDELAIVSVAARMPVDVDTPDALASVAADLARRTVDPI